jgi:hypothetical protein
MQQIIIIALAVIAASLQTLLFPWLSIYSNQVPLVPVFLVLVSLAYPHRLLAAGLAAGLALDLTQVGPVGFWALFFALSAIIWRLIVAKLVAKWWWRLVWLVAMVALLPVYAQIQHYTPGSQQYWFGLIVAPSLLAVAIATLPCWISRNRNDKTL